MLRGPLPKLIDPVALARAGTRVEGDLPLADLTRLCGCLTDDAGVVDVVLEFGTNWCGICQSARSAWSAISAATSG